MAVASAVAMVATTDVMTVASTGDSMAVVLVSMWAV